MDHQNSKEIPNRGAVVAVAQCRPQGNCLSYHWENQRAGSAPAAATNVDDEGRGEAACADDALLPFSCAHLLLLLPPPKRCHPSVHGQEKRAETDEFPSQKGENYQPLHLAVPSHLHHQVSSSPGKKTVAEAAGLQLCYQGVALHLGAVLGSEKTSWRGRASSEVSPMVADRAAGLSVVQREQVNYQDLSCCGRDLGKADPFL